MPEVSIASRVGRLDQLDACDAGVGEVAAGLGDIRLLRGWLDSREADLARRQDELAATSGAAPAADVLGRSGKTSRRTAQRIARRAETLGDAPALAEQLADGRVSVDHVDALGVVAGRLDEPLRDEMFNLADELAAAAAKRTPEQFRRHLNDMARNLADDDGIERSEQQRDEARLHLDVDQASGMGELRGELHPDDYQKVNRRIDAEIRALRQLDQYAGKRRDQLAAVALVNLVTGQRAASRVPAEVVIHVGLEAINGAIGAPKFGEYLDGAPVPIEAVRRHACDAQIIPAVLDGKGMALDVGRSRRLATPSQRHALRAMYRTCAVGDCNTGFDRCEVHHVLEWQADQGPTDLRFLFPVCSHHHHRLHEGRWRAELDPSSRELAIRYPNGSIHSRSYPDLMSPAA